MGLCAHCSFLWLAGQILGLTYGAEVTLDELDKKMISGHSVRLLNLQHSCKPFAFGRHSFVRCYRIFGKVSHWLAVYISNNCNLDEPPFGPIICTTSVLQFLFIISPSVSTIILVTLPSN